MTLGTALVAIRVTTTSVAMQVGDTQAHNGTIYAQRE